MMYAIIKCSNGSFSVHAEGYTSLAKAKVEYFNQCRIMWNADDVITGEVAIVDEQLDVVEGYKEYIHHEVVETAE